MDWLVFCAISVALSCISGVSPIGAVLLKRFSIIYRGKKIFLIRYQYHITYAGVLNRIDRYRSQLVISISVISTPNDIAVFMVMPPFIVKFGMCAFVETMQCAF